MIESRRIRGRRGDYEREEIGKFEGSRSLGNFRRGKVSFEMEYKEMIWEDVDWINLVQTSNQ
jgi:hypothetical protein